jgi:hexokinase
MVAVILGTGTNACYIEKNDFISKLRHLGPVTGSTVCCHSFLLFQKVKFENIYHQTELIEVVTADYQH